jgi:NAD(P)-dependent dehydrogenase (short-subunit alcohol dehydrogenase family)
MVKLDQLTVGDDNSRPIYWFRQISWKSWFLTFAKVATHIINLIKCFFGFKDQETQTQSQTQRDEPEKPVKIFENENKASQSYICSKVSKRYNSILTRHSRNSCHELHEYDSKVPLSKKRIVLPHNQWFTCYGCGTKVDTLHPVYVFSCVKCGNLFQKFRYMRRDLSDRVALVIGARTKLGHQILLKLVRAGATAVGTTRYPNEATELFSKYSDYAEWAHRLHFYPYSLDLDKHNIHSSVDNLAKWLDVNYKKLDILVNCAAQTIRVREKHRETLPKDDEKNRYGDAKFVNSKFSNSWQLQLQDLEQSEMEEVYRINAVAPLIIIQGLIPLLQKSQVVDTGNKTNGCEEPRDKLLGPFIINVHAREGLFDVAKSDKHIHLNMAKAGLAMLTKCLVGSKLKTPSGVPFSIHGCDPGWFSIDEYYEETRPWIVPPLDEIDGAARILYPVFKNLTSCSFTRKHFTILTN